LAIEAVGAAAYAIEDCAAHRRLRSPDELLRRRDTSPLEHTPALALALANVHRMPKRDFGKATEQSRAILDMISAQRVQKS